MSPNGGAERRTANTNAKPKVDTSRFEPMASRTDAMKERGLRSCRGSESVKTRVFHNKPFARRGGPLWLESTSGSTFRRRSVVVQIDGDGERVSLTRIDNTPAALAGAVSTAGEAPEEVLEATYGWYWAADLLAECGASVHLATRGR